MNIQSHAIKFHADPTEVARALELSPESFGPDALRSVAELLYTTAARADSLEKQSAMLADCGIEPGDEIPVWVTLDDLLNTPDYDRFIGDRLGNDLATNDPDRFARIQNAAEHGGDGSTHAERIEDMRDFVQLWFENNAALPYNRDFIELELDKVEQWHELSGTLDEEAG